MERQIATNHEQSSRLLRCGVSADTADMHRWVNSYGQEFLETYRCPSPAVSLTPAWSLSALLTKVLPSVVDLRMLKLGTGAFNNPNAWSIMYSADLYTEHSDIFEACVLMAEKLIANGYKLNEQ